MKAIIRRATVLRAVESRCDCSAPHHQILRPHHALVAASPAGSGSCRALHTDRRSIPSCYQPRPFRQHVRSFTIDPKTRSKDGRKAPPFAFAFDIDGVLLHVAKPIPGATETLRYLQQNGIPFILLTNGGGKHEAERVADLSDRLGVELYTDSFVQSHTPFQELVSGRGEGRAAGLADKNILITGSNAAKARIIAKQYGFRNVVTPADILVAQPAIWPFEPLLEELYARTATPLPNGGRNLKIDAIFVFNDPRDWALDTQIITDLLMSEQGVLGTYSAKNGNRDLPRHGWQTDGQPRLYFSNPDLFWSAGYHLPRFGQGAFQAALTGIWNKITAGKATLQRMTIGKPYHWTYEYAERVLSAHRARVLSETRHHHHEGIGEEEEGAKETDERGELAPLRNVYMVGDNPESDIRGANEFRSPLGTTWNSVLVRTGVWTPERGEPTYQPKIIVDNVKRAVEWALWREGW